MEQAKRTGVRADDPYGYPRAFSYVPNDSDRKWLTSFGGRISGNILDPTAGGGSIPFESVRLGLTTYANDLNPVAAFIEYATIKWPAEFGGDVNAKFLQVSGKWRKRVEHRLVEFFPQHNAPEQLDLTYIWARTIRCPYCEGLVPLSPNWRLAVGGTGVRLIPRSEKDATKRRCDFEIVSDPANHSPGTVADGDATCPFPECTRVIEGTEIKRQAQAGEMGEQLYAIVFKRLTKTKTKAGKEKISWERGYRAPTPQDDTSKAIANHLTGKMPEWEALDSIPNEALPMDTESWTHGNSLAQYGAKTFRDLFSDRQLLCHATGVEVFNEILEEERRSDPDLSQI